MAINVKMLKIILIFGLLFDSQKFALKSHGKFFAITLDTLV